MDIPGRGAGPHGLASPSLGPGRVRGAHRRHHRAGPAAAPGRAGGEGGHFGALAL